MQSDYIYEWFTRHFRDILSRFDPNFEASWIYTPTEFKVACVETQALSGPSNNQLSGKNFKLYQN